MDFEAAARTAIVQVWPGMQVDHCSFHMVTAMKKRLFSLFKIKSFKKDSKLDSIFKVIF